MHLRITHSIIFMAVLSLLVIACQDTPQSPTPTLALTPAPTPAPTSTPTPIPSPYAGYLTEEIPPCVPAPGSSVDPCAPAPPVEPVFSAAGGGNPAFYTEDPLTIRGFLDGSSLTYIPHIVLRGIYLPDTVRCTSGNPNRTPSYVEPGYTQNSILINCYADVQVNEYILGKGPSKLTLLVDFHHYWHGYYAHDATQVNMTEAELIEQLRAAFVLYLEQGYEGTGGIYGRELILFVGPGHSHAHEVWEVFTTWNVERKGDSAFAVHPHRDDWQATRPEKYWEHQSRLEMELSDFKKEVLVAYQARVAEYGGSVASVDERYRAEGVALPKLISDIHSLDEFMTGVGAYDHPDGPPIKPPPAPGLDDPVPNMPVDDATPAASPTPPGGLEDHTPTPAPRDNG